MKKERAKERRREEEFSLDEDEEEEVDEGEEEEDVEDRASREVRDFLVRNRLGQYESAIVDELGFDDMETLLGITEKQLKKIGMKEGHIHRLMRAMEMYQNAR